MEMMENKDENIRYLLQLYSQRDVGKAIVQGESWSSGVIPSRSTSAQRLPTTGKTRILVDKNGKRLHMMDG